jgi:protoheme IX farnesyltransferase
MSASALAVSAPRTTLSVRLRDYVELTKPRIAILELVVVATAAVVATWGTPDPLSVCHAMVGTLLVAASASAANQWLEQGLDGRMKRTANRPLPAGRLGSGAVLAFAAITLLGGIVYFVMFINGTSLGWALATWIAYVCVYTPLKTRSAMNTAVGAVAGALPVLIGWTATGNALDVRAVALALLLFLWQFPHFMAIAWLYRGEYGRAGYKMLTVVEPTGQRAGWQAVIAALALIPISLLPVLENPGLGSVLFIAAAGLLGLGQLALAIAFWRHRDDFRARLLLRASLVYLPTILLLLVLVPWV